MNRTKQVRETVSQRPVRLTLPIDIRSVKAVQAPVRIGGQVLDREIYEIKARLPNGDFIELRVSGKHSEEALVNCLAADPYFAAVWKATQVSGSGSERS